ncbi:MAG: TetR/AcrR family transcriptional regulator [Ruminiclostridium sp.]|nr:TetR/AcrR family transcriptional regulator [Ruminiclostridium sp.]
MEKTANPVQTRSQKTKENLMKAALSMYEKKGYHKSTVDDIAAEAGVSTGIAYRYFRNKKDLLLSVISYGVENVGGITGIGHAAPENPRDMKQYLEAVLNAFEEFHIKFRDIHEELEGLKHTDRDVRMLYSRLGDEKMKGITARLTTLLNDDANVREKAYLTIGIMEQHCHMMMNNELYGLDAEVMRKMAVDAMISILKGTEQNEA